MTPRIPRYLRLAAIQSRISSRPGFWWHEPTDRYRRVCEVTASASSLPEPSPRVRLGSSLPLLSATSARWHELMLKTLDTRYCPFPCARCEPMLALDAQEEPYNHARDMALMGGAR